MYGIRVLPHSRYTLIKLKLKVLLYWYCYQELIDIYIYNISSTRRTIVFF